MTMVRPELPALEHTMHDTNDLLYIAYQQRRCTPELGVFLIKCCCNVSRFGSPPGVLRSPLHVTVRAPVITFPAACAANMIRQDIWTVGRLTLRASRIQLVQWEGCVTAVPAPSLVMRAHAAEAEFVYSTGACLCGSQDRQNIVCAARRVPQSVPGAH